MGQAPQQKGTAEGVAQQSWCAGADWLPAEGAVVVMLEAHVDSCNGRAGGRTGQRRNLSWRRSPQKHPLGLLEAELATFRLSLVRALSCPLD